MPSIKRIFYIYTEASLAVFMLCSALVELLCGLALGEPFLYLTCAVAALFLTISGGLVYLIYKWECSFNARVKGAL